MAKSFNPDSSDSPGRVLVFRLSSLGDVVLSSSALQTRRAANAAALDWVAASEFSALLEGHPRLRKVWKFDRSGGTGAWIRLCRELWLERYDEVWDLHSSIRSRAAKWLFRWWSWNAPGASLRRMPRWKRFRKNRMRLIGQFVFKALWPRRWISEPLVNRFSQLAGGDGSERPDLRHLSRGTDGAVLPHPMQGVSGYVCVMPGAHWPGKRWPARSYADAVSLIPDQGVVVLGGSRDLASLDLAAELRARGTKVFSDGIGNWDLPTVARVLAGSSGYLGNDTGLAHLAEAVGTRAAVVFGPTVPEMGFGPWRPESRAIGTALWCRPCGKDGRSCFRWGSGRYRCLREIPSAQVAVVVKSWLR